MQAIKKITCPEGLSTSFTNRHYSYNISSVVGMPLEFVDWFNNAVAEFLEEFGILDCRYESRGSGESWLWIRGVPYLFFIGSSSTWRFLSPNVGQTAGIDFNVGRYSEVTSLYLNACGNPNGSFVLRLFNSALNYIHSVFFFPYVDDTDGAVFQGSIGAYSASSSTLRGYGYLPSDPSFIKYTVPSMYDLYSIAEEYAHRIVPDSILIFPNYLKNSSWIHGIDTLAYQSAIPFNDDSVGYPQEQVYQQEMEIGGHRYLVMRKSWIGLIRLDDDDPPTSEEDLMAGVET